MSAVDAELKRVHAAFAKPTLALLKQQRAPVVIAVFATHFSRERIQIPAERFHLQVETSLDELRLRGEDLPDTPTRDLCRAWVQSQWMTLSATDDGTEQYALTSHAQEALDYVKRLSAERTTTFGESRVMTILDAARRCATEANPDRDLRLARLNEQIEKLTTERDRIVEGGQIEAASDERMLDEYLNLSDLLAELPRDFMRVSEAVKEIHRQIITDFRNDDRRSGDVLDDYLDRADSLMSGSPAGRAFTGAVALLRSEDTMEQLKSDLDSILDHGFADSLLPHEKSNLRRTVSSVVRGIEVVLSERRRLSGTLRTYMSRHDALRDRELDETLRSVATELTTWMNSARPRDTVPLDLGLGQVSVAHLRHRLYDPAEHAPPPALTAPEPDGEPLSFDDLRKQGGPSLVALVDAVESALATRDSVTTAEIFADLPPDLRRPVEVMGLIHLAAGTAGTTLADSAPFEAIRPDGSRRIFHTRQQVFTRTGPMTPNTEGTAS